MSEKHAALEDYRVAPAWMEAYVERMRRLVKFPGAVYVLVAPDEWFASISAEGQQAEGACMFLSDGGAAIILPDSADEREYWYDVLAHEFAHVVHSPIDRLSGPKDDPNAYVDAVEQHVKMLGGLIQFAVTTLTGRAGGVLPVNNPEVK